MTLNRKDFLRTAGLAGAGMMLAPHMSNAKPARASKYTFQLGLASYTFREFSLDTTIEYTKRLGISKIALKSMHLPLDSSEADIKAAARKIADAGLELYGAGVIYMKTEAEVNQAFAYAKAAGMKMIIGVPNYDLLPLAEKKVKETDIKLAIHNHGPGDDLYRSPKDVYEKVKGLDKRIGLCMDIGHVVRIGEDPSVWAEKFKDRIYDIHLKDEDKAQEDGKPLEIGRGVTDIPAFLRTMIKVGYTGYMSLEYEKDGKDPLAGAAESFGYVRGVLKVI
ncbi:MULTISPECIES: sugar phosphate isomerase/epimerase [unclassified Imperialibacter]|uniref:sugar phosphate isomerase/epimerase family protein n=1 Tax=unclassified Imperialibacter TaxID=2629706 RepID=UPI0012586639|nr:MULTISPECIES: sugar phosphate isomerase/epimerase [unclassified Imperialibacter]CAD5264227.1 Xylose isomerase [Imperialibacter sp. 89]CAD5280307.1 Xylose isomerase [Imperialibacter sp. 75]VVT31699.1 Xylose isomerase [Imperialibacter sp. EC-SDR9]